MRAIDEATGSMTVGEYLQKLIAQNQRLNEQNAELQARMTEMVHERRKCAGLQRRVLEWVETTFQGNDTTVQERGLRFLEEAIELSQSLGVSRNECELLIERVYSADPDPVVSELAGAGFTLLSLAGTVGVPLLDVISAEAERLEQPENRERARRRQAEKRAMMLTASNPSTRKGL